MSHFGKKLLSAGTAYVPSVIGEEFGGGYYAGRLKVDGQAYVVILAPNASGYNDSIKFATSASKVPSGLSAWDGNANHAILIADSSTYPAAAWANGLSIGGFTDWHIPSEAELDVCYRAFRPANAANTNYGSNPYADPAKGNYTSDDPPATTLPLFVSGGGEDFTPNYYLTSSPSTTTTVIIMNFNGGLRVGTNTSANRMLRATRLVKVYN